MRRGVFVILALLAPLACACALNPPRIVSISPGREASDVATNQAITISFDRAMNHESVEQRFGLSPALPGCSGSKNCHFAWSGNTLTYIHDNAIYGRVQTRFRSGSLGLSRKIGYLVAQPGQPAFAVGIVDPHADGFLGRSTPKIIYRLSAQSQLEDAILSFDWSPDGQRLVVVQAPRSADAGPIQIVDVATGTVIRPGIRGSAVYWSQDGTIVYRREGTLRRFRPSTLEDIALTDSADGRVNEPGALSPDGKSIAYSAADAQGVNHLWILNLDLRSRYRPIGLDDPADHPVWSPNGTKLAFRRLTASGPELWVYDLSASGASSYR